MTIRTKITVLSIVTVTLALGLVATTAVLVISQSTKDLILQAAAEELEQAETSVTLFQSDQTKLVESLAGDPTLWKDARQWTSYVGTKTETKLDPGSYRPAERAVADRFQTLLASFDHLLQIEGGTSDGRYVMAPPQPKPAGYDPSKRPWYGIAVPGKVTSTGVRQTTGGDLAISYVESFSSATATGSVTVRSWLTISASGRPARKSTTARFARAQ